jgi:hypothetical protein
MKRVIGALCLAVLTAGCGDSPVVPSRVEPEGAAAEEPSRPSASHTLSGQVLCDRQQPILLASVSVFTAAGTFVSMTFTDLDGRYTITGVSGPVLVIVSAVGFEPQRTPANVTGDLTIDFTLERLP